MDVTVVKGGSSSTFGKSSLSSKDREAIKEKFKNFNAEFDALVKAHKSYNITDQSLRQLLAKEVSFISPLYHRFYDKHSGGDFSKHVDKVSIF
jgi:exocyst complex protein 7